MWDRGRWTEKREEHRLSKCVSDVCVCVWCLYLSFEVPVWVGDVPRRSCSSKVCTSMTQWHTHTETQTISINDRERMDLLVCVLKCMHYVLYVFTCGRCVCLGSSHQRLCGWCGSCSSVAGRYWIAGGAYPWPGRPEKNASHSVPPRSRQHTQTSQWQIQPLV